MTSMAEVNYDQAVPYAKRNDEIGEIAAAVEVFRVAGLEKRRLEAEAEQARTLSEGERAAREERRLARRSPCASSWKRSAPASIA